MVQPDQMNTILLFTDAATSPQTGIAVGAFLCLERQDLKKYVESSMENIAAQLAERVVYEKYESKKSTWSEIKTVIHALDHIQQNFAEGCYVEIYTDCQSVCDLLSHRKEKLEKNNFITRSGKILQNAMLYQELFAFAKKFHIQTFKIKGHHSAIKRVTMQEKIFAVLDKLSRKKLRSILRG